MSPASPPSDPAPSPPASYPPIAPLDEVELSYRFTRPSTTLAILLALCVAAMVLPQRLFAPAKERVAAVLRPGLQQADKVRSVCRQAAEKAGRYFNTAARLAEAEQECARLREENLQWAAALDAKQPGGENGRSSPPDDASRDAEERLLQAECVGARVLGQQARSYLQEQHLLDVGANSGVRRGSLVADDSMNLLDRGREAGLEPGGLVLHAGRVWGRVVEVGAETSAVRTVADVGFREVVRIASPTAAGRPLRLGPQGILEGTGESTARLRMIEVTEPVEIGDQVYATGEKGVLPKPLLCGRVVRVSRPAGAIHWDIGVEPAVRADAPDRVAVLCIRLNPARMAAHESSSAENESAAHRADRDRPEKRETPPRLDKKPNFGTPTSPSRE
jgi:cell shape-determining protein MreC